MTSLARQTKLASSFVSFSSCSCC